MHLIYLQRIDFPPMTHPPGSNKLHPGFFGVHSVLFTPSNKAEPQRTWKVLEYNLMR